MGEPTFSARRSIDLGLFPIGFLLEAWLVGGQVCTYWCEIRVAFGKGDFGPQPTAMFRTRTLDDAIARLNEHVDIELDVATEMGAR